MNTKRTIRKILFVGLWLAIGTSMVMLLIAAIGRQKKDICKDYVISIKAAEGEQLFLDRADVVKLLKAASKGSIKGQPKTELNLWKMEQLLEENVWVKDAQLYFDNQEILHVKLEERAPIARVFTAGGRSFYIDEHTQIMQLSDKVSARLPVFTGFPDKKKLGMKDSFLLRDMVQTAALINKNKFWTSQVAQLDITPAGTDSWEFTMVPLVGSHIIRLGDGKNMEQKFNRLFIFYKEVLSKTGFDKYKTVDVRYNGQVVAGRSENPKVDQAQLRKSVDALLRQIKEAELQAEEEARSVKTADTEPASPVIAAGPAKTVVAKEPAPVVSKPVIKPKADSDKGKQDKPAATRKPEEKKETTGSANKAPKAVMPKKEN